MLQIYCICIFSSPYSSRKTAAHILPSLPTLLSLSPAQLSFIPSPPSSLTHISLSRPHFLSRKFGGQCGSHSRQHLAPGSHQHTQPPTHPPTLPPLPPSFLPSYAQPPPSSLLPLPLPPIFNFSGRLLQ